MTHSIVQIFILVTALACIRKLKSSSSVVLKYAINSSNMINITENNCVVKN